MDLARRLGFVSEMRLFIRTATVPMDLWLTSGVLVKKHISHCDWHLEFNSGVTMVRSWSGQCIFQCSVVSRQSSIVISKIKPQDGSVFIIQRGNVTNMSTGGPYLSNEMSDL